MTQPLLLAGGYVVDPSQGLDGPADILFRDGKVAAIGPAIDAPPDAERRGAAGRLVTPGLIDYHTHVYWGGMATSVEPDALGKSCGMTTAVDAGSAGAGNILGFHRHVADRSESRVLAFLNISYPGIFGVDMKLSVGEAEDLRLLSIPYCVEAARRHAGFVVGVKVRVGLSTTGALGLMPLDLAIEAADALGLPVMAHIGSEPPPRFDDIVDRLRPGDILTHCYKPHPNAPVRPSGGARPAVRSAYDRGVVFDLGHGLSSFGFDVAREMLALGMPPHVISSDVHTMNIDGPAHDVLHCLAKMMAIGMGRTEAVRAVTETPARLLRRPDLGSLRVGSAGDAAILRQEDAPVVYRDSRGATVESRLRLACNGVVLGGRWWSDGHIE